MLWCSFSGLVTLGPSLSHSPNWAYFLCSDQDIVALPCGPSESKLASSAISRAQKLSWGCLSIFSSYQKTACEANQLWSCQFGGWDAPSSYSWRSARSLGTSTSFCRASRSLALMRHSAPLIALSSALFFRSTHSSCWLSGACSLSFSLSPV